MKYWSIYIAGLFSILILFACQDTLGEVENRNDNVEVKFQLDIILADKKKKQRSISELQEDEIVVLDVFVFDNSGNFVCSMEGYDWVYDSQNNRGSFKTLLPPGENYTILIIANAHQEVQAANTTNIDMFTSSLIFNNPSEWRANINNDGVFKQIPMYGKISEQRVSTSETTIPNSGSSSIILIRMLARIDVALNTSINNFNLTEAYLFQRNNQGFVPYNDNKWDGSIVLSPNIPSSVITTKLPSSLIPSGYTISSNRLERAIYTFEAGKTTDRYKATALIVGGKYNSSETTTYYRIDFPSSDSHTGFLSSNILRNHRYIVEISNVSGKGNITPEKAYDEIGVNIEADVSVWDMANVAVDIDSQYNLYVEKTKVDFLTTEAMSESFYIYSNHPLGASITDNTQPSWLQAVINKRMLIVSVSENITGLPRNGSFTIRAGNLSYTIKVSQV